MSAPRAELRNGAFALYALGAAADPERARAGTRCRIVRVYRHQVRVRFIEGPAKGDVQTVHPDDLNPTVLR